MPSEPNNEANPDHEFSMQRRHLMEDFTNGALTGDVGIIRALWQQYSSELRQARGIFVVDSTAFPRLDLPSDQNFGSSGFLRCWMSSLRLILVRADSDDYRYYPAIFCDTNFVRFCAAFQARMESASLPNGFIEAVSFVLPYSIQLDARPYLLETFDHQDREIVRRSLFGFACLKITSPSTFRTTGRFVTSTDSTSADEVVTGWMRMTETPFFRTLGNWAKTHFLWSKVTLTQAAIITFRSPTAPANEKLCSLLQFLHERLGRLHAFEIYAAFRFFQLSARESFFAPVQRNSSNVLNTLKSMAWDCAHWRTTIEFLTIESGRCEGTPFAIPYFLSFDRRFVQLLERFQFRGLIYDVEHRRPEFFFQRELLEPASGVLRTTRRRFEDESAVRDRGERAVRGEDAETQLESIAAELDIELDGLLVSATR